MTNLNDNLSFALVGMGTVVAFSLVVKAWRAVASWKSKMDRVVHDVNLFESRADLNKDNLRRDLHALEKSLRGDIDFRLGVIESKQRSDEADLENLGRHLNVQFRDVRSGRELLQTLTEKQTR